LFGTSISEAIVRPDPRFPAGPSNLLTWFGGRVHCEYINVAYQLRDVNCDGRRDGGFNCIPGRWLRCTI
jgi:hypothetical protein